MKYIIAFVITWLLAGCSIIPPKQAHKKLTQAPSCCQQLNELVFQVLPIGQHVEFQLGDAPAFNFEQGKSYFIALERPANSQFIEVTSWLNGILITHANLVYPLITVLNRDKNRIGTLRSLEDWHNGWSIKPHSTKNPFYRFRVTLPEEAQYLIVHADPAKLSQTTPYTHKAPNGSQMYVDIGFNVVGRLTLSFN